MSFHGARRAEGAPAASSSVRCVLGAARRRRRRRSVRAGTSPSVFFRVGAPTNDAAIVAKQGKGTVEETGLARGAVAFFAPRAAGAFVFRLLDPEPPGQQQKPKSERPKASSNVYATSDKLDVVVRTHDDLLDSLKASLQQLEEP